MVSECFEQCPGGVNKDFMFNVVYGCLDMFFAHVLDVSNDVVWKFRWVTLPRLVAPDKCLVFASSGL